MPSDHHPRFNCPTCGKSYRWKPEMAGRSAKCGCGGKLVVPGERPATVPASTTDAPTAKPQAASSCPSCAKPLVTGAVLCVNCGYNLKTGQKLSAAVVVVDTEDDGDEDDDEDSADDEPAGGAPATGAAPGKGAKADG